MIPHLIQRKRDGESLTSSEWSGLVAEYTAGRVPDYQMAALLMAVYFSGLDSHELSALTDAMLSSGGRLERVGDLPWIDKHSTGGVGDKVSLVLAPLVASCGVVVPMMSGRGLGHTGGTLDKLEAIPGFKTDLTLSRARDQVERIGCVLIGQTPEIAPADRKLYALRDVTATVEAIPLIAASIMSKKLAEGLTGLVLDVKYGSGAFLPQHASGLELAQTMIRLGEDRGCPTVALLTAMDRPLGHACGNALETAEALAALKGDGPQDLMHVTFALGAEMLVLAGVSKTRAAAADTLRKALDGGHAAEKAREVIEAQDGNPAVLDDPTLLPAAPVVAQYRAPRSGTVARVEPRALGRAIVELGGGRSTIDDDVDLAVGFVISVKPGDPVQASEPIAEVHARDEEGVRRGVAALEESVEIVGETPDPAEPLISHRVTKVGVDPVGEA